MSSNSDESRDSSPPPPAETPAPQNRTWSSHVQILQETLQPALHNAINTAVTTISTDAAPLAQRAAGIVREQYGRLTTPEDESATANMRLDQPLYQRWMGADYETFDQEDEEVEEMYIEGDGVNFDDFALQEAEDEASAHLDQCLNETNRELKRAMKGKEANRADHGRKGDIFDDLEDDWYTIFDEDYQRVAESEESAKAHKEWLRRQLEGRGLDNVWDMYKLVDGLGESFKSLSLR